MSIIKQYQVIDKQTQTVIKTYTNTSVEQQDHNKLLAEILVDNLNEGLNRYAIMANRGSVS